MHFHAHIAKKKSLEEKAVGNKFSLQAELST